MKARKTATFSIKLINFYGLKGPRITAVCIELENGSVAARSKIFISIDNLFFASISPALYPLDIIWCCFLWDFLQFTRLSLPATVDFFSSRLLLNIWHSCSWAHLANENQMACDNNAIRMKKQRSENEKEIKVVNCSSFKAFIGRCVGGDGGDCIFRQSYSASSWIHIVAWVNISLASVNIQL